MINTKYMIIKMKTIAVFTLMFTTFIATGGSYQLERVEPPFWWTGMKHSEVQVMMYGENIAALDVELDYEGVQLKRVQKTDNPNYLFVYLDIKPKAQAGKFDINLRKQGENKASYTYELKQRQKGSALREGFNSSDVMYLLFPDRFANGNPDNDQVEGMKELPDRSDRDRRYLPPDLTARQYGSHNNRLYQHTIPTVPLRYHRASRAIMP